MTLQPCRTALGRSRNAVRISSVSSCLRAYSASSTTSSSNSATTDPFKDVAANRRDDQPKEPRWQSTPARMKAPLRMDFAKNPKNKVWTVNSDPERLDQMYIRLLGPRGDKVLPDDLKWLAVTHKSFDQGRRGFNDRLALMGRFTLMMEATKLIVGQKPQISEEKAPAGSRKPFSHPQLLPIDNLTTQNPRDFLDVEKLFDLASETGLVDVMRWKPRLTENVRGSGADVVANAALFAIIGAITLQHGSVIASEFARNKILVRLERS